jgi:hypothetical protein
VKTRFIGLKGHPGWRGKLPHWEVDCELHGLIYTYEQGHYRIVGCPICEAVENMHLGAEELRIPTPGIQRVALGEAHNGGY